MKKALSDFAQTGPNPGGLRTLYYIPTKWVIGYPRLRQNYIYREQVEVGEEYRWLDAPILPRIGWNEGQQTTAQGSLHPVRLTAVLPFHNAGISETLNEMKQYRYLLHITDRHNQPFLLGTKHQPFSFSSVFQSGEDTLGFKHHRLTFDARLLHKAMGYEPR